MTMIIKVRYLRPSPVGKQGYTWKIFEPVRYCTDWVTHIMHTSYDTYDLYSLEVSYYEV